MRDRLTKEHREVSDILGLTNKLKHLLHRNLSEKILYTIKIVVRRESRT